MWGRCVAGRVNLFVCLQLDVCISMCLPAGVCLCGYIGVWVHACVCACVCAWMCVCECACGVYVLLSIGGCRSL